MAVKYEDLASGKWFEELEPGTVYRHAVTRTVTEQVPETTVHDTEPVPEPPVLVIDSVWPYVAEVDDTESAACEVRLMVMAVSAEFTAL